MKFVGILMAFMALSASAQELVVPEPSPEELAKFPLPPPGISCVQPQVWWEDPAPGLCDCWNRKYEPMCTKPGVWIKNKCYCRCPWWGQLFCSIFGSKDHYFDKNDCKCKCKEPCRDCSSAVEFVPNAISQVWSEKQCTCMCPQILQCDSLRFFDYWTCNCQCRQKPRPCCPSVKPWKHWSHKDCDCVCSEPLNCLTWLGYYWDKYLCMCVKKNHVFWGIDYEAEAMKVFNGEDNLEGVLTDAIVDVTSETVPSTYPTTARTPVTDETGSIIDSPL